MKHSKLILETLFTGIMCMIYLIQFSIFNKTIFNNLFPTKCGSEFNFYLTLIFSQFIYVSIILNYIL